jgi:enamine deaminase RidA (YjgF/YER057c/UK114 family)
LSIEATLARLGLTLPPVHEFPNPNRSGSVQVGTLLFVSGHPPIAWQGGRIHGKVPGDVSEAEAYRAAESVALNMLASIRAQVGTLDRVKRVVKIFGMVNSSPGFNRQFAVVDGASDLLVKVWGPRYGQHARSAVGMFELPRDIVVEIEGVFELHGEGSRVADATPEPPAVEPEGTGTRGGAS